MTAIKNPSHGTDCGSPPQVTGPSRRSRARRLAGRNPLAFTVAVIVAVILILPFVTLIISSLTPASQMGVDRWLPTSLRWANFADATRYIPFWSMTRRSVFLSSLFAVLTTFSSALTGYGFARLSGPGKKILFALLIGTMMVPPIVTLIPTYLLFSNYHLVGTYWPWVLWGAAGTPYAIFLYRQYFSGFPKELSEAAVIDGAGQLRIFFQVFLPLSRPGGSAWRQTTFYPFALASRYGRGRVLAAEPECHTIRTACHGDVPALHATAVIDDRDERITVFAVNRDRVAPLELLTEFRGFRPTKVL
jgi:ABC-type glycerol-3-phosphate transport system permease component